MSLRVTGLEGLKALANYSQTVISKNRITFFKLRAEAERIFGRQTPVKTGATLESEGSAEFPDGFAVWADIDYSLYNDQGFRHWRSGKRFKGYHYSDLTVNTLSGVFLQQLSTNVEMALREALAKRF